MVGASLTKIIFGHFSFEITWLDPKLHFFFHLSLKT